MVPPADPAQKNDAAAGCLKAGLFVLAALALITVIVAGAGWFWWKRHGKEFLAAGKASIEQGTEAGRSRDEQACLQGALDRERSNGGFRATIDNSMFLHGCFMTSRPTPGFCDNIPRTREFLKTATWRAEKCSEARIPDSGCQQLFSQVQEHCEKVEAAPRRP